MSFFKVLVLILLHGIFPQKWHEGNEFVFTHCIINKVGSLDKAEDDEELFKNEIVIAFEKDESG